MTILAYGRRFLPALAALLLWAVPALAQQVGVNTAVNPEASGTPPGGAVRRLVLGQEVLYNERITTQAAGQTQIQFLDESSLTVGPNSDVTVDQFVYNPNTGTGRLAMNATRGILRYVGGKLSKGDNPVTIQTPTATLAVRGGVFLASVTPAGQLQVVFLYGKGLEVTAAGVTQTIPRPGFAVTVAGPGAPPSYPFPAPRGLLAAFTAALDGRPGATGGARVVPSDQTVAGASTVISGDLAASIQQAAQSEPPTAQPPQLNIGNLQQNLQVNTVAPQQPIANRQSQPSQPVVVPISGGAAAPTSRLTPNISAGAYIGTITYPNSSLQNGSLLITPANIVQANPGLQTPAINNFLSSVTGGAVLSPLSAGATNTPVSITLAGTFNGSSTVTAPSRFSGQTVSLNVGTVATGTATVSPDGQFFTANLAAAGPFFQQFAPDAIGKPLFVFGGVPTVTMPTAGIGTYTGTAIGQVDNQTFGPTSFNEARYTATGNFNETFNFAARTGTINITNFDGANYAAAISGAGNTFSGNLTGPANRSGPIKGSFFGPVAGEVGGTFSFNGSVIVFSPARPFPVASGSFYSASGIVTGR